MAVRTTVLRGAVTVLSVALALGSVGCNSAGCNRVSRAEQDAAPIVEQNVAARGGLKAWRAVRSMSMAGLLDAGKPRDPMKLAKRLQRSKAEIRAEARRVALQGTTEEEKPVQLPFVMELKRPAQTRLDIEFQGQTAVQVFDGTHGWKLRPFLGRREVEPYTADELRAASAQQQLDGALIDAAAKGTKVELVGTEPVDGRPAHKLKLTLKDGQIRHVWVDTRTFLEAKIEGTPRRLDGKFHPVETHFHDYRSVDGLMIPHELETRVEGVNGSEKIIVERVAVNPPLADARFAKPE